MISLEKHIPAHVFKRNPRSIFAIHSNNGSTSYFLTKETAYQKMEEIEKTLTTFGNQIERVERDDLDARIDLIVTKGGSVYSLLTLPIEY